MKYLIIIIEVCITNKHRARDNIVIILCYVCQCKPIRRVEIKISHPGLTTYSNIMHTLYYFIYYYLQTIFI